MTACGILSILLAVPAGALANPPGATRFTVTTLAVGYGESHLAVLRDGAQTRWAGLLDAGDSSAGAIILDALRREGISALDAFILSHAHANHYEGLDAVIGRVPIRQIIWPGLASPEPAIAAWMEQAREADIPVHRRAAGSEWEWHPELRFVALNGSASHDAHAGNLVGLVIHGRNAFLFPGDLSPGEQPGVADRLRAALARHDAVLQWAGWPHHGDRLDESWVALLQEVPLLLVSVGPNAFGMPRFNEDEGLRRRLWRTDLQGPRVIVSDGAAVWDLSR